MSIHLEAILVELFQVQLTEWAGNCSSVYVISPKPRNMFAIWKNTLIKRNANRQSSILAEIWVYLQDQMKVATESELSKSKNTPQIPF